MTVIVIHCSRQQVLPLADIFGKIHLNRDGTKTNILPEWLNKMYYAAKINDYRKLYNRGFRMITHHIWS